jgi:DNA-binding SARP family transcriptional activator
VEFRILGPLEVLDGDTPVEIAGSKRRAVLALLLLHANEVVRSERLVDELWGEQAPRNAPAALHNHVSRLRKALGPEVLARREWGYVLRADEEAIDLRRFERLVAAAEPLPARERSARLAEALRLWRGPALADLANEPGLQTEIARLDELRLTTLERRIDADLEAGRNAELVGEIEALIAAHPLREHLRWQLILALYRAGRQAEALEVYRETRRVLTEELGLEPSPELRELERAILRQDPAIAATVSAPPSASIDRPRRSSRRAVLLALLMFALVGLGVAVPVALVGHTRAHRGVRAAPVAPSSSAATTQSTQQPTSPRPHVAKRTLRPRQSRRVHAQSRRLVVPRRTASGTASGAASPLTKARSAPVTTTERTHARKPRVITISDAFSGDQIDGTIWYPIREGSGWTLSEHDGHLEFRFPPGTTPGPPYGNDGGHVGTLCKFPGDFDARVAFTLAEWPPGNGLQVALWSFLGPSNVGWQSWRRSTVQWGEQYGSYTGTSASVALDDTTGKLRLVRKRGLITAYFLHNRSWQPITSGRNTSLATIAVGVNGGAGYNTTFGGQEVIVDFDQFTVTGADPICPPGAQSSG